MYHLRLRKRRGCWRCWRRSTSPLPLRWSSPGTSACGSTSSLEHLGSVSHLSFTPVSPPGGRQGGWGGGQPGQEHAGQDAGARGGARRGPRAPSPPRWAAAGRDPEVGKLAGDRPARQIPAAQDQPVLPGGAAMCSSTPLSFRWGAVLGQQDLDQSWPQKSFSTLGKWFSNDEKWEKGSYLKKPSAPDFKTYIFGIVLQFLIDWLKRNFWFVFQ